MITLKEFFELYDNWNGTAHINDNSDEIVRLENGRTSDIAENSKYLDNKVVAFGVYDNEMFIRVDYIKNGGATMINTGIIPIDKHEFTLETNGWSFHICLGSHAHGNYIAIPDWGVCTEAADWSDTFYNKENLGRCKNDIVGENANAIAEAVKEYMTQ